MCREQTFSKDPIAVFDSGIGGLTIFKAIKELLPNENILYLADNQRMPYGSRDRESIIQYTKEAVQFFLKKKVKLVVFACHTVSSTFDQECPIPIINVIQGGLRAIREAGCKKIAILGTVRTIESNIYAKNIDAEVIQIACPNLASQIESQDPEVEKTIEDHLANIQVDAIFLGCTHYPLVRHLFKKKTLILDSSKNTALAVKEYLTKENLLNEGIAQYSYYATEAPDHFAMKASFFLGENVIVKHVNLVEENFLEAYKR